MAEGLGTQHTGHRIDFISSKENIEKTLELFFSIFFWLRSGTGICAFSSALAPRLSAKSITRPLACSKRPLSLGAAPSKLPAALVWSTEPSRMECCAALGMGWCCQGGGKGCLDEMKVTLPPCSHFPGCVCIPLAMPPSAPYGCRDEGSFPPGHVLQTSHPPAHQSLALIKRQTYKQAQTLLPGLMEAAKKL